MVPAAIAKAPEFTRRRIDNVPEAAPRAAARQPAAASPAPGVFQPPFEDDIEEPETPHDDLAEAGPSRPRRVLRDEVAPRRRRRASGKKHQKSSLGGVPIWAWAAGGAGSLLLAGAILLIIILRWAVGGPGGGSDDELVVPAHEAVAATFVGAPSSWVPHAPVGSANSAEWNVNPDPVKLATDLASVFPLSQTDPRALVFSGPESAQAGILYGVGGKPGLTWDRYDLRTAGKPQRVQLSFPAKLPVVGYSFPTALSPSGERLALGGVDNSATVTVYSAKGMPIGRAVEAGSEAVVTWVQFATEDRVLALRGGDLICYDLSTGQQVYSVAGPFTGSAVLSPGRQWVVGFTGKSFQWISVADGSRAGSVELPAEYTETISNMVPYYTTLPRLTFRPDGERAVGVGFNKGWDLLIAIWDIRDGQLAESFVLPRANTQQFYLPPVEWCGERQLIFSSGQVVDIDLHSLICSYGGSSPRSGPSPDGRRWYFRQADKEMRNTLEAKLGLTVPESRERSDANVLCAFTAPHLAGTADLDKARDGGFIWHPGVALRVTIDGRVPKNHRDPLLKAVTGTVTRHGCRIDPSANYHLKLTAGVTRGKMSGDDVIRLNPLAAKMQPKVEEGYLATFVWELTDSQGRQLLNLGKPFTIQIGAPTDLSREFAWLGVRAFIELSELPSWYLRDKDGNRLRLTHPVFGPGIDGFLEPPPAESRKFTDKFRLEGDPLQTD
jgi:hypothetical protein